MGVVDMEIGVGTKASGSANEANATGAVALPSCAQCAFVGAAGFRRGLIVMRRRVSITNTSYIIHVTTPCRACLLQPPPAAGYLLSKLGVSA